jgi:hypothetical protein
MCAVRTPAIAMVLPPAGCLHKTTKKLVFDRRHAMASSSPMALFLSAVSFSVLECVERNAYRKSLLKEIKGILELSDTLC